jgi:hypothetical protein
LDGSLGSLAASCAGTLGDAAPRCRRSVFLAEPSRTDAGSLIRLHPRSNGAAAAAKQDGSGVSMLWFLSRLLLTPAFLLDLFLFPIRLTDSWCFIRDLECRSPELAFCVALREPLVRLQRLMFDF